jgi:hypothetical protein
MKRSETSRPTAQHLALAHLPAMKLCALNFLFNAAITMRVRSLFKLFQIIFPDKHDDDDGEEEAARAPPNSCVRQHRANFNEISALARIWL